MPLSLEEYLGNALPVGFLHLPSQDLKLRLGIRVSLQQRMRHIGGRATVLSSPGAGTTVTLSWSGPRGHAATAPVVARSLAKHPLLERLDARPVRMLAVVVLLLGVSVTATRLRRSSRNPRGRPPRDQARRVGGGVAGLEVEEDVDLEGL